MTTLALTATPPILPAAASSPPAKAQYSDCPDFSFHDFVSIFNPLQHFPVVSTLYRAITGDTIGPFERIAGDTLYGGWMGLASSVANLVFEKATGRDFGDTVLAFAETGNLPSAVTGDDTSHAGAKIADLATPAPPPSQTGGTDRNYGIAALAAIESGSTQAAIAAKQRISGGKSLSAASPAVGATQRHASTDDFTSTARTSDPARTIASAPVGVAGRPQEPLSPGSPTEEPGAAALESSLHAAHIDPATGRRALEAYRKSVGAPAAPAELAPAI